MRKITTSAVATMVLASLVGLASCSLLTNFTDCQVDEDCAATFGPRALCVDKICEVPVSVTGGTCTEAVGPIDRPRAFVVGILLPLSGPEAGFGVPLMNAIRLAYENFDAIGGVGDRPLALLVCDTEGVDDVALEAGRHAIEEAQVTAIIGPDFSSQTIDIATQYAIPNDVLLVTPSGTAATITSLDDKNLVWRTAPSDVAQAEALRLQIEHHITEVENKTFEQAVVWLLRRETDTYGIGLEEALLAGFPADLTGSPNFHASVYPTNWEDSWFSGTAQNLPEPDVVIILGAAEAWDIAEAADDLFDTEPTYFFVDAARNGEEASVTNEALEGRVLGTAPQNAGDLQYPPYTNFKVKYEARYDEDPTEFQFVANAYDALHVVALAAAGGGISGPELAEGMGKLSSGEPVTANSMGAQEGLMILREGDTIDFQGASGRLDFDDNGDPSASAIALWCFVDGAVPEAGELLDIAGTFTPLDCSGAGANNPNNGSDMGSTDMGGSVLDMGPGGTDTGSSVPDMGPVAADAGI